ncbi:thiamine pyrophosphate-dependent enzyme [Leucobacter chromiiresistens]|uniref:Acetolactate synthase-1/2/3 large subunit n=1 Tax=Leucobacter chromiiresistens TaxID=1079994 RepID=A0A1H0XZV5_9MICO|nr:thiamine pyrophosphate-dependent enzyme [Leucobacter chromiiresistens]SDQ08400.1 acetolactate synthase-1/2/3 large subunit [Leucobacter chromiiresistens]
MSQSAGHLIVRTLEAHGVPRVYAVPGESYLDVLDGLHDSTIETVVCRQEGGAGFMALAEGRLTGLPGVAMVTRGPGAANAMIAIHTAWQDATPLVLFVGLIPVADRERDSFQEFSLTGWFGSTAKRVVTIDDADRAGELVAEALRVAAAGRPGPVVVGLPEDVLVELTDAAPSTPIPVPDPQPSAGEIAAIADRLARAERPAIIAGGDGWHTGAGRALLDFAADAGVPVFADWRAYDAVPHEGPAWAGWLGYGRADAVAAGYAAADLLVFVGCGRSDVMSDGYRLGFAAETVLVSMDPEAAMHAGRIDQQVLATPAAFVEALGAIDRASARGGRGMEWMDARAAAQQRFAAHRPDASVPGVAGVSGIPAGVEQPGVDLGIAFGELDDRLGGRAVLTFGAGNATIWAHRFVQHRTPASLVGARNGAMGLAVPAAVAASLAFPERPVVAVCGDGDFMMNGQELATAFAHGAAPLVIVVDNGIYGTIVQHQERHYPGRPSGTRMANPDFAAWMRSFGGHGERVERTEEFAAALDRALAAEGPALIHLLIDESVMPPAAGEIAA